MIKFLADENFNRYIVTGLLRRVPEVDILRVQDVDLEGMSDRTILEFAASDSRVVLSHDVTTMVRFAYERILSGAPFAGLVLVKAEADIGEAIEGLSLLCLCSGDDELQGQVHYLSL